METPLSGGLIDDRKRKSVQAAHRDTILRALRRGEIDLIHLHGIDFPAYLPPPGIPALVTLHLPPSWYDRDAFLSGRPATYVNCVSRSQEASCPPVDNLIPYIENGVDIDAFSGEYLRKDYALTLGRICPEKGYHIAMEAAKRAGIQLLLAGEVYSYESHLRYFSEKIMPGLDDRNCRFLGAVDMERKHQLLAEARCLLIPSLAPETSSLVAMEALASGTPVIAFPAGALIDIVEDGITGYLVRDGEEMAAAIGKADRILPENCRASARKRFSSARMTEEYFRWYEYIIGRGKNPFAEKRRAYP